MHLFEPSLIAVQRLHESVNLHLIGKKSATFFKEWGSLGQMLSGPKSGAKQQHRRHQELERAKLKLKRGVKFRVETIF